MNQSRYCGKCGAENQATQNFCAQCGTGLVGMRPQPSQPAPAKPWSREQKIGMTAIGMLGVIALWCMAYFGDSSQQRTTRQANSGAATSATLVPTATPPPARPADTLALAKSLIGPGASKGQLTQAQSMLLTIPQTAPEHNEAQRLVKQWGMRLKEIEGDEESEQHPLEVISSHWERSGFDTVAVWHVTFYNRSKRPVGDITYRTAYFSETGNKVDAGGVDAVLGNNMIQKIIPPGQKRTIEVNDGFLHSQAARASFELVAWRFVD